MAPQERKAPLTGEERGMNQARDKSMKTFEELYAEPPPYTPTAQGPFANGSAPPGCVPKTEDLNFQPSPLEIPTPAECIAHLKLLHAFAKLRRDVGNCEGLYGIGIGEGGEIGVSDTSNGSAQHSGGVHEANGENSNAHTTNSDESAAAGLAERLRDKRWSVFVTKAVDRYSMWWVQHMYASTVYQGMIRKRDFEPGLYAQPNEIPWSKQSSPPLHPRIGQMLTSLQSRNSLPKAKDMNPVPSSDCRLSTCSWCGTHIC